MIDSMFEPDTADIEHRRPCVLTIAGSDPSGGAGLQADLQTCAVHGVAAAAVVTLLTVQNTVAVTGVQLVDTDLVMRQLDAVLDDTQIDAIKLGALGCRETIIAVAERLATIDVPIIVDPVMVSKHGDGLLPEDAIDAVRDWLLPLATLLTPNRHEIECLANHSIAIGEIDAQAISSLLSKQFGSVGKTPPSILVKNVRDDAATDVLWHQRAHYIYESPRIERPNVHGSGCVLSAAIAAIIARHRRFSTDSIATELPNLIERAIRWSRAAISSPYRRGEGISPPDVHATIPPI